MLLTKNQNQLVAQDTFFICSYISNMFRPDLLATCSDAHSDVSTLNYLMWVQLFWCLQLLKLGC